MPRAVFKKISKWLIYNIFIFGCIIILSVIAISFSKDYMKSQNLKHEIYSLQGDISKNEKKILELSEFLKYLDSKNYAEKKARTELGLKKPDENVVVIPKSAEENIETTEQDSMEAQKGSNIIKWWNYFFRKNKT